MNKISKTFDEIHKTGKWLNKDSERETSCGKGSKYLNNIELIEKLPIIIEKYGIKNIIDIGCGDVNWIRYIFNFLAENNVNYYGLDVSDIILEKAKEKTKEILKINQIPGNIEFHSKLISSFNLEGKKEETLIISKDVLVHLPNKIVLNTIQEIQKKALYALLTNFPEKDYNNLNKNIKLGEWRPLDLTKKPFNLINPIEIIPNSDKSTEDIFPTKNMSLFKF